MSLPKSIQSVINQHSDVCTVIPVISHHLADYSQCLDEAHAARGFMLQDGIGKVQVIAPGDALIDLQALNQQLKRDLRAIPKAELAELNQKMHLDQISAIPASMGVQTVVDNSVFNSDTIYLDSGCQGSLVKTQGSFFQKLAEQGLMVTSFTVPAEQLEEDLSLETTQRRIENSVQAFTSKRIIGRLEDTLELPPLPATAERILALLADPDADIEDLTQVVEMDPSLAAQVVSWAQSPYYSAPGKISSIHEAIVRVLGYDLVMNLSLGLALSKTLTLPKEQVDGNLSFWEQSVFCAALMEGLSRAMPPKKRPNMGLCYLAGLLHNFGYLLLAEIFPPHFTSFCRYMEVNTHLSHSQIEQFLLQTNREQIGYWLMHLWGLPEEVSLAVRFQHHPEYHGDGDAMAKLLFVATRLLRQNEPTDICLENIPDSVLEELHIDRETLIDMAETVFGKEDELQNIAKQFG